MSSIRLLSERQYILSPMDREGVKRMNHVENKNIKSRWWCVVLDSAPVLTRFIQANSST